MDRKAELTELADALDADAIGNARMYMHPDFGGHSCRIADAANSFAAAAAIRAIIERTNP